MIKKLAPGCTCCGEESCPCCIESITINFKKGSTLVASITIDPESAVRSELIFEGENAVRCIYTAENTVTCEGGDEDTQLPGYIAIVPLEEVDFTLNFCQQFGGTFGTAAIGCFNGVQRWKTNFIITSCTLQITKGPTKSEATLEINGIYELCKFPISGSTDFYTTVGCVYEGNVTHSFDYNDFACVIQDPYSFLPCSNYLDPAPVGDLTMRHPWSVNIRRTNKLFTMSTLAQTGLSCSELLELLVANPSTSFGWLHEYYVSISDQCGIPKTITSSFFFESCGQDIHIPIETYRTGVEKNLQLVEIAPDIVLC